MTKKKSGLLSETIMYSVHKQTGDVITHHLPWERGNPQLELYEKKGFTYESPVSTSDLIACRDALDAAEVPDTGDRKLAVTDDKGTHILEQNKGKGTPCGGDDLQAAKLVPVQIYGHGKTVNTKGLISDGKLRRVTCPSCGKAFKAQGIKSHMRTCRKVKV